jgi:hypothetical protein
LPLTAVDLISSVRGAFLNSAAGFANLAGSKRVWLSSPGVEEHYWRGLLLRFAFACLPHGRLFRPLGIILQCQAWL